MTLNIMSSYIMILNIMGLFMTLSMTTLCYYTERHYAECHVSFIVTLNVIMLSVVAPWK
jgi:hypothetical protein